MQVQNSPLYQAYDNSYASHAKTQILQEPSQESQALKDVLVDNYVQNVKESARKSFVKSLTSVDITALTPDTLDATRAFVYESMQIKATEAYAQSSY